MKKLIAVLALLCASSAEAQVITGSVPNTFVNGTVIDATQVNADYTYIINQVNANAAKNGVNSDITALTALATPLTPAQSGSSVYYYAGLASGTVNAIVVPSAVPANFTLAAGKRILFQAPGTNTGAVTLAVNGTTATPLLKWGPSGGLALTGGELNIYKAVEAYYDGSNFILLNDSQQYGGFGPLTPVAGGATVDLGAVGSHNVNITGGPHNITSFGSTADPTQPIYLVRFNATDTIDNTAAMHTLGDVGTRVVHSNDQALWFTTGSGVWYELAFFEYNERKALPGIGDVDIVRNTTTHINITGSNALLKNGNNGHLFVPSFYGGGTCGIDFTVNGLNGLDTGAIAAGTWYYIYAIASSSDNSNCIASANGSAPALPAGYTYYVRIGAIRTYTASATLWEFRQRGNYTRLLATSGDNTLGSGVAGTCPGTLVNTANIWGSIAPSTAASATVLAYAINGGTCVATTATAIDDMCAFSSSGGLPGKAHAEYNRHNSTLAWCGSTLNSVLTLIGWKDQINAY
jgi:hypothetical protein